MTSKNYALAAALIGAAAIIGAAFAGPLPLAASSKPSGSVATPVSATTDSQNQTYCYSGVKGTPNNLSRGWVCQRETAAPQR